jgi:hypothetical protein
MKLLVLSVVAMSVAIGCNEKKSKPAAVSTPVPVPSAKIASVLVPDSVKGKWKAVKIEVADKIAKKQSVYTVVIGTEFRLPDSNLALKVDNFLPAFVMEGTTPTSRSNQLVNPAAQLTVSEGGREIFKGWLFALYPTTHAFQHPQYGFTLVDYQPAS